ncbi:alpha/beta fold hydrolase [Gordonia sp. ABSL1-1]|uniref:alpha/beta fold hydrolase n=1 Tax=Gordonia sp. ABSL1-1 TaxID=3053923 RepID=UPI002574084A|nr:alpha/beta fold hydrolase [Gordonia sp. ABSL1-1]MDL9936628.1 alpha/beta fold hydrolase [Gordonia sp. ABSL1-1]
MIDFIPEQATYPFTSRWFDSSVGQMHYLDEGSGPCLLFCHGAPTWSYLYRTVITGLRDHYRCIAVDYPGFGLSARPDGFGYTVAEQTAVLGEFVDALGLHNVVIVGQDWGGPIGLGVGVRRAARIRGIVLSNTAFWPIDRWPNRAFSAVMGSRLMRRRILDGNFLVEKFLLGPAGPDLTEAEANHYRSVQPTPQARRALVVMPREIRAARPLLAQLDVDVRRQLADKPAVAVWGMRDKVFPPSMCLPRLREAFTDLEVIEVGQAGHYVPEDDPDQLITAIRRRFP